MKVKMAAKEMNKSENWHTMMHPIYVLMPIVLNNFPVTNYFGVALCYVL
jgi:hypothetical protein